MTNAVFSIPTPSNEPVLDYLPRSDERCELSDELKRQQDQQIEIPLIIGGREIRTGRTTTAVVPHRHRHVLATVHEATETEVDEAVEAARAAKHDWLRMPWEARAAIFLKAADLLSGPWRAKVNAATMLNQSKTAHQAEIDAACELIDFFRFNCDYLQQIYGQMQPPISPTGAWNRVECRPLEGFVYAVTPFNFTSIAGNLPHAPALMGNTVIWKPSPSVYFSNYVVMKLFEEAGLPPGVINFVPGDAAMITNRLLSHPEFAGLHFTGSTGVLKSLWRTIADNIDHYREYPRIVGESGGKDFIVAHSSADRKALIAAIVRGAFEFQGQKCSAVSRLYLPRSVWDGMGDELLEEIRSIRMGDTTDFRNFMGAVIHQGSFDKCKRYIDQAKQSPDAEILAGCRCDDSEGYFIAPTLILAKDPHYVSMREEIFGPIVTAFIYEDDEYEKALELCNGTSPYGLTGAIFSQERGAIERAADVLRYAAGNFYINDKPTGAVVGQQPFGGSRASGTNDKAGSALNLLRWMTPRTIKETFVPARDYRYGFLGEETDRP